MRFLVIFLVALALANAAEEAPENGGFLRKLTKWLSSGIPMFGPIRTTPKPMFSKPKHSSEESIEDDSMEHPAAWGISDEEQDPSADHEISAEAVQALEELYNMDELKDVLPPMDSLLEGHPIEEHPDRPAPELDDPHVAELIQHIMDYFHHEHQHASNSVESESESNSSE